MTSHPTPKVKAVSDPGGAATRSHGSGALQGYRELMARPGARGTVVVSLLSKYPNAMFSIGVLLLASPEYSASSAALGTGVTLLASSPCCSRRLPARRRRHRGDLLGSVRCRWCVHTGRARPRDPKLGHERRSSRLRHRGILRRVDRLHTGPTCIRLAHRVGDRGSRRLHPGRRAANRSRFLRHTCESGPVDMRGQR